MKAISVIRKHIKLLIILAVLIAIAISAALFFMNRKSDEIDPTESLRTDVITKQDVSNYVSMTGTVTAKDSQTVYATLSNLEVLKVNVKVGDTVKKGDVIAVLDSTDYENSLATAQRQLEVDEAKTALRLQQAAENLQDARVDGEDSWKEQDIKVANANTDYYYAQVDYQQACDRLAEARADLQRAKDELSEELSNLRDKKKHLKKELEDADDSDKSSYRAKIEAVNDQIEEIENKLDHPDSTFASYYSAIGNAENGIITAQENLEKSQRTVDEANETRADTAENQRRKVQDAEEASKEASLDASVAQDSQKDKIKELQDTIDSCTITAPISGVVTSVSMEVGNTVSNDKNTICVIQDVSEYKVEGTIDEYDIAKISEGMEAVVKTESNEETEMRGVIDFVSPTPQTSSGSSDSSVVYPVKIILDGIDDSVRIGMTAAANILLESADDVLTVPYDCVGKNADGEYVVYAVDNAAKDGAAKDGAVKGGAAKDGVREGMGKAAKEVNQISAEDAGREIVVKVGLITDYYVEISSDEIKEGMEVYVPSDSAISVDEEAQEDEEESDDMGRGGHGPGRRGGGF